MPLKETPMPSGLPDIPTTKDGWMTKGRIIGVNPNTMKKILGRASHLAWRRCAMESGTMRQKFGKIRKMRKAVMKEAMASIVSQTVKGA